MAAVSLLWNMFWNSNIAAVTSCENAPQAVSQKKFYTCCTRAAHALVHFFAITAGPR